MKIRNNKSVADVVHDYFPEADESEIDFIMWNETGWPAFWDSPIPEDRDSPEDCMRLQLARLKWDLDNCQPTGLERMERYMKENFSLRKGEPEHENSHD